MTPSVGGREKAVVAVLLVAAGTATGALVGFVTGGAWLAAGGSTPPAWAGTLLGALALAADRAGIRPLAVGRQVPREWSDVFAPATVAVLYGARLGVGPLTILRTWLWWAAFLAAATTGPGGAALAGGVFGATRGAAMVAVAEWARPAMSVRMAQLRAWEPRVGGGTAAVVLAVAALTLLAAA